MFFFSLSGSSGYASLVAGLAGCSLQLFGYGFASARVKLSTIARCILCGAPVALSILTTYATLSGYVLDRSSELDSLVKAQERQERFLDSVEEDVRFASDAAKDAMETNYKKYAVQFLETNADIREKGIDIIQSQVETATAGRVDAQFTISGFLDLVARDETFLVLFSLWCALMFDLLPMFGVYRLSSFRRQISEEKDVGEVREAETNSIVATATIPENTPLFENKSKPISSHEDIFIEGDENVIIERVRAGDVKPKKKELCNEYGIGEEQAESILFKCLDMGVISRSGRGFQLKTSPKAGLA